MEKKPNRLLHEKSPYLQQHAYNPVDWYPWGNEAFAKAQAEDKPIFLSVGYSTCYWCHVMEREVFENDELAALMNRYAVNIKLDREERPDIDRIYMKAVQAMTGSGGWPMSVFMTHELKPFYAATYIPPVSQYGRPGFGDVINTIADKWKNGREQLLETGNKVYEHLRQIAAPVFDPALPDESVLDSAFEAFKNSFDPVNKGFGGPPKFPTPVSFTFLLRYYARTGNREALYMTIETLEALMRGGIHDHLGGGFHRYATDENWHVPHFEKMLYDQAQLAVAYLEAFQITGDERFERIIRDTLEYVTVVFGHPEGGFYSAEDAESALSKSDPFLKKEGAFYTWKKSEVDEILSPSESDIAAFYFGLKKDGNVAADPHGIFSGENILHNVATLEQTADQFGLTLKAAGGILSQLRKKLFAARQERPKCHLDDKIILSWNGMMISAFARSGALLGEEAYLDIARRSANLLFDRLYDGEKRLFLRRYRSGEAKFEAHLEDYAFLAQGLIDLYEASFEYRWLQLAVSTTDRMIELLYDQANGGFYDTTGDDPSVIIRTKEWYDGAEASGNAIAALNLLRLSSILNRSEYNDIARKSISAFGKIIERAPQATAQFLAALDFALGKPIQIVIATGPDRHGLRELTTEVHRIFLPRKTLMLADGAAGQQYLASDNPFIESLKPIDGKATAYVCENFTCNLPVTTADDLRAQLERYVPVAST